ncbi:MAG: alcohol dehydrogenase catalytic domain-containing protein [Acidobacteriota bacterium]|nr:alcohol dehydrogenase catalytic domain-containing protein [Acidobacteriota bacterium]
MLAVHLENGVVAMRDVPVPHRPEGYALLRLILAGICNTDLELERGYYGFSGTPGHEFVAEVVDADRRELIGRRVAGEINLACTRCEWCARGLGRHCPNRTVLGIVHQPGAFQEFFVLPERNLHILPALLSLDRAVFLEPLAAACEILDQVAIPAGERVAVLGDGKLGLLIAQVLRIHGCRVHLYGRHAAKLAIAAAAGVEAESAAGALPAAAYGFVVDATGSAEGLRQAAAMTHPRGTLILKSTVHGTVAIDTAPIIVNEITLVGSRCGRFEAALPLIADPRLRLEEMVAARFPLAEAPAAFAHAARRGTLKVLLAS